MSEARPSLQRSYLTRCANCSRVVFYGARRDGEGRTFCSDICLEWANAPYLFCEACSVSTTDVSSGNMTRINGIGPSMIGAADRCAACRSVVRRVWFTVLFVPLIPFERYRVIRTSPTGYYSRRLR
jgi:hypothetical protein